MANQSNEGSSSSKKKRTRNSSEHVPAKKQKPNSDKKKATPKKGEKENNAKPKHVKMKKTKFRAKRRKTTGMRQQLCKVFERALIDAPELPVIHHLFISRDSDWVPRAKLIDVLRTLQISKIVKNTHFLNNQGWKSISNISSNFAIEEDEPGVLYIKYWPIYNSEKCTVYVDNLPEGCKKEKLERLVACYGNVADVKVVSKPSNVINTTRRIKTARERRCGIGPSTSKTAPVQIDVGSGAKFYGFVRFVEEESAREMIKTFHLNDPSLLYEGNNPEISKHGFHDLALIKLMKEIRKIKFRKRRRTVSQSYRLDKLQRRFQTLCWRESRCRKQAMIQKYGRPPRKSLRKNRQSTSTSYNPKARFNRRKSLELPSLKTSPAKNQQNHHHQNKSQKRKTTHKKVTPRKKRRNSTKKEHEKPKRKSGGQKKREKLKKMAAKLEKEKNGLIKPTEKRKRKRRRKFYSRKVPGYIPGNHVRLYFDEIQVLSLSKYKRLRKEYMSLVKAARAKEREQEAQINN